MLKFWDSMISGFIITFFVEIIFEGIIEQIYRVGITQKIFAEESNFLIKKRVIRCEHVGAVYQSIYAT